jgi:hypothetical protein
LNATEDFKQWLRSRGLIKTSFGKETTWGLKIKEYGIINLLVKLESAAFGEFSDHKISHSHSRFDFSG